MTTMVPCIPSSDRSSTSPTGGRPPEATAAEVGTGYSETALRLAAAEPPGTPFGEALAWIAAAVWGGRLLYLVLTDLTRWYLRKVDEGEQTRRREDTPWT